MDAVEGGLYFFTITDPAEYFFSKTINSFMVGVELLCVAF